MPITPTYPGVYVQEVPSGVRTIVGVSTAIAVFIGRAKQGPMDEPVLCLNYTDFERVFSSVYAGSDLARAVRLFFMNGGTQCYVMRIADGATYSEVTLKNEAGAGVLKVKAKSPGLVGDTIRLAVTYNGLNPESTFNLEIFRWAQNSAGTLVKIDRELWTTLSMDPNSSRYAQDYVNQNSNLVKLEDLLNHALVGSGYSQSGRAIPTASFAEPWKELLFGIGPAVKGTPWTGTSTISTSGTYTGSNQKTYTFTVATGGLVGTDPVAIGWSDGTNSGTINLTGYTGSPVPVAEGLQLAFTLDPDDLVTSEKFTVDVAPLSNRFRISVNSGSFVEVALSGLTDTDIASSGALIPKIQSTINSALPGGAAVTVTFPPGPGAGTQILKIESTSNGDVRVEPASSGDLAAPSMLGTAQGGIEISRYAQYRPAPNGIVFKINDWLNFANQLQTAFNVLTINSTNIALTSTLQTGGIGAIMHKDGYVSSITDHCDGVREKWSIIADAINAKKALDPTFKWSEEVWGSRLALIPGEGGDNSQGSIATSGGGSINIGNSFIKNVRYYSLGPSGQGLFQVAAGAPASDGNAPKLANYRNAFMILDKKVDLFNLMILPQDEDHSANDTKNLWGPASVFCQKRRAFLLMDAPAWDTVQKATNPATGVNSLRIGLVKDHSAVFYPRVTIQDNGLKKNIGASGAIAGLMARIDGSRGVWKAPAGTEAALMGILGLEYKFSDDENGVLNPRAINTLRVFPNGIVNWGARTMDGDDDFQSEYKYIPVRRLALFIEESLYRGTQWVVFEPNDEPLWSQIRLNVGAFMHRLFKQGAFQGTTPKEAYLVKCDKETTTQTDINSGIVNIIVGFAPLKPAEFVIIKIQQLAGQIET
jgi:phage tail sheath protein FI